MVSAKQDKRSLEDLRETYPEISQDVYYLWAARDFWVWDGVFFGETIHSVDALNAGDTYGIARQANWVEVFKLGDGWVFSLPEEHDVDVYTLHPYAHLIFVSQRGQGFDVWPVRISGIDHLITDTPLRNYEEYTLIEFHADASTRSIGPARRY